MSVRKADHMKDTEGRYRRFCMSDEQASLHYTFNKIGAKSYAYNYAYRSKQLDSSIKYVRNAIGARIGAGERLFIIDLTASGAPVELSDPFNRITVKNALNGFKCAFPGVPGKAKASLSLTNNQLLVRVKVPTYRVKKLTRTQAKEIIVEVDGANFSALAPLELADKVLITPEHATQKQLHWKSYTENTAVVDQNGRVRIVGFGSSRIMATTIDGSKKTCTYRVTVKRK